MFVLSPSRTVVAYRKVRQAAPCPGVCCLLAAGCKLGRLQEGGGRLRCASSNGGWLGAWAHPASGRPARCATHECCL